MNEEIRMERSTLIQKALNAKKGDDKGAPAKGEKPRWWNQDEISGKDGE